MCGGNWRRGSVANGAACLLLLAAAAFGGLKVQPAAAQTGQSPATINPVNPQDRTLTNPQDMSAPQAVNQQNRRGPSPSQQNGSLPNVYAPPSSTLGGDLNGSLNAKLGGPIAPGSTTLERALEQAYYNNPTLNAQRAATRVVDENVTIALSGYRPRVTGSSSLTDVYIETLTKT